MRTRLRLLAALGCALVACGGGSTQQCQTETCTGNGLVYSVCTVTGNDTTYDYGTKSCACASGDTSCATCSSAISTYCGDAVASACTPPASSSFTPSDTYRIEANASFTLPPTQTNPWLGITSDGAGAYHIEWTDPTGGTTCFTGLVTLADAFTVTPTASTGAEAVVNDPGQLAFAGTPGVQTDYIDFGAGTDVVDLEVYVDSDTPIDVYFTDSTGQVSTTSSNVAAFQSP